MIKIVIGCDGVKAYTEFKHEKTTLGENAIIVRILEELKLELLDFEYKEDFQIDEEAGKL